MMNKFFDLSISFILLALGPLFYRSRTRNKSVVLGNGFNTFSGHTKYLAIWLSKHTSRDIYWVSNAPASSLPPVSNIHPIRKYTLAWLKLLLTSRYLVITHNVSDISPTKLPGHIVINLWHGLAIKPIGFDSDREMAWINKKRRTGRKLPYEIWDYFCAQSEQHKRIINHAMRIPEEKILVTGSPTADYLLDLNQDHAQLEHITRQLKSQLSLTQFNKVILYAPTFRESAAQNQKVLETLMEPAFQAELKDQNFCVLLRTHPSLGKIKTTESAHVRYVNDIADITELYLVSDLIVTDYSSAMFDFSLLDKPCLLFLFDIENYLHQQEQFYFDVQTAFPDIPIAYSSADLIPLMQQAMEKNSATLPHFNLPEGNHKILAEVLTDEKS